uniref:Uncharacterized protein n=1 Tax=Octopus bimaculoides TaxID=37653 RepID=A0A0L8HTS3_OCTBM
MQSTLVVHCVGFSGNFLSAFFYVFCPKILFGFLGVDLPSYFFYSFSLFSFFMDG